MQETLLKAFRSRDAFEGRSAMRTCLVSIATRVCLDELRRRKRRRERPMAAPPGAPDDPIVFASAEAWVEPMPDAWLATAQDPHQALVARQSVRLAFVAALQQLPPRQRAALLLTEVLGMSARDAAEALETSVAATNSALQRARATLAASELDADGVAEDVANGGSDAVDRYVQAFEAWDVDAIAALLADDVRFSMPPIPLWLQGPDHVAQFLRGTGSGCEGSILVPIAACASPAFAQYKADGTAWGVVVLELRGDVIAGISTFLDTERLFPVFGVPLTVTPHR